VRTAEQEVTRQQRKRRKTAVFWDNAREGFLTDIAAERLDKAASELGRTALIKRLGWTPPIHWFDSVVWFRPRHH